MSASTDIRHSRTDPDVTSMELSIPKPTSEMLAANTPATTATKPSSAFHTTVKYSSLRPRSATSLRSKTAHWFIFAVYTYVPRSASKDLVNAESADGTGL